MSGGPGFRIDAHELELAAGALASGADEALGAVAEDTIDRMAGAVLVSVRKGAARHRRTGRLEANVRLVDDHAAGMASTATVRVIGRVAPIIVGGSARHVIRPRRAGALAFATAPHGFASRVEHPGTRPDPFFARGVAQAGADIDRITDAAAETTVARLAELAEG